MAIGRHFSLAKDNKHLLDIFSDDCYLELGNISNTILNKLLKKKLVRYSDLTYFDIQNKGIGSSNISHDELERKIPFMYFENLHHKKPSRQLFVSHGVLVQKRGYKEYFTPIILIPVNIFFKDNDIWLHMVDSPIENPYLPNYRKSIDLSIEKIKEASSLDEFCINCFKLEKQNLRFENYLTFGEINLSDRRFFNDKFNLEGVDVNKVYNGFDLDDEESLGYITSLNRVQRMALEQAKHGNNFALTGVSGTGKTRTLINIAANSIYKGDKVLYISNNTETLKEVKDFFRRYDLDYLLSDFSNPFEKIEENEEIEIKQEETIDNIIKSELHTKYDGIRDYTKMLYEKINGYYFIDVMKGLIEFKDIEEKFNESVLKGVEHLYNLEIKEVFKALQEIDDNLIKIDSFKNSKFNNIPIKNTSSNETIFNLLNELYENYKSLNEKKVLLENEYGFANISNYAYFRNMINNYRQFNKKLIPNSWLDYEQEDSKKKILNNFSEAKIIFSQFSEEMALQKSKEMILDNEYAVNKIKNLDIHNSIKFILSRFEGKDVDFINNFLKNNKKLSERLVKLRDVINKCEYNFGLIRDKLAIKVNYQDVDTIEQFVPMILYFGSHKIPRVWLDIKNSDNVRKKIVSLESSLKEHDELLKVYNKYFNDISNIENNLIYLRKKSEKNDKYQNYDIKTLIEQISRLKELHKNYEASLEEYYAITLHNFVLEDSLVDEFDNFINLVNAIKNESVRNRITKNLMNLKDSALKEFVNPFIKFSTMYLEIKKTYEELKEYEFVSDEIYLPNMINKINDVCKYSLKVLDIQKNMGEVIKRDLTYIPYQEYVILENKISSLDEIREKINNNKDYEFLFGSLFKGYKSDVDRIDKYLLAFALYTNIFKDNDSVKTSMEKEVDKELDNILSQSSEISEKISGLLTDYSKIFRDSVGRFYYEKVPNMIEYLDGLTSSKDELETFLLICDAMKVLLKYKLYNLNEYIIENDRQKCADRFMLSYYKYLYDKFVNVHPTIINSEGYYKLLDDIMVREQIICDKNIEKLRQTRIKRSNYATFKNQTYMSYLNKVVDYKYLVLSNSQIVNLYLEMDYFDLVIIDDANLLNAEHYYKALNGRQVIIAGLNDVGVSIAKDIVSKIKKSGIIELKKRYIETPFSLLNNVTRASGVFYSDEEKNQAFVFEKRDLNEFVCDLLITKDENGKDVLNRKVKINYFVKSLNKQRKLYDDITNALLEKLSLEDIFYVFIKQLNICDLYYPYLWNSDYNLIDLADYANEADVYKINNLISALMCTKKKLIVIDKNDLIKGKKNEGFLKALIDACKKKDGISPIYDSVCNNLSKSLADHKFKVLGKYHNFDLVIQKKKKNYGIIIFNAPTNYGEDILNVYRDHYNSKFPYSIVFLNEFVDDYDAVVSRIIEETKNEK